MMMFLTTKQKREEDHDDDGSNSIIGQNQDLVVKVDWYNYDHGVVDCRHHDDDSSTGMICRRRRRKSSILFVSEGSRSVFYYDSSSSNKRIPTLVALLLVVIVVMLLQLNRLDTSTTSSNSRILVSAFQYHNGGINNLRTSRSQLLTFQAQGVETIRRRAQKTTKKNKNNVRMMKNNNNNCHDNKEIYNYDDDDDDDEDGDTTGSRTTTITTTNNNNNASSRTTTGTRRELFVVMSAAAVAVVATTTSNSNALATMDSTIPSSSTVLASTTPESKNTSTTTTSAIDTKSILEKASRRALSGGKAGASAAVVQVLSLMWLRTAMNYQYRYGGNLQEALDKLTKEGGLGRLYQGLPFALVQGPLTRFGDTAANVGVLALLESIDVTRDLPLPLKTLMGSLSAGLWRILIMPVDTYKTTLQVQGSDAFKELTSTLVEQKSIAPLYRGSLASAAATAVGHFPWFLTYNFLNAELPQVSTTDDVLSSLLRSAFIGLCASSVSDITSNSLRVIKTTKQTMMVGGGGSKGSGSHDRKTTTIQSHNNKDTGNHHDHTTNNTEQSALTENLKQSQGEDLNYIQIVQTIIEKDGLIDGLLLRGLSTRLLVNALQGALFSVLWKYFQTIQQTTGG